MFLTSEGHCAFGLAKNGHQTPKLKFSLTCNFFQSAIPERSI
jgi:hypothetical protein